LENEEQEIKAKFLNTKYSVQNWFQTYCTYFELKFPFKQILETFKRRKEKNGIIISILWYKIWKTFFT